jgi:phosphoglycerol transferase
MLPRATPIFDEYAAPAGYSIAGAGLLIAATALILHNLNLVVPLISGDEYAYFSQSREFPDLSRIMAYDPSVQQTNNTFYFWLGHLLWENTVDPALAMRVVQSLLYVLNVPILFFICRRFMPPISSAVVALLAAACARSSYSGYFMPETLYAFLFLLLVLVAIRLRQWPRWSAAASGFFVAMLLLTKPHGIAIVLAMTVAWSFTVAFPRLTGISRHHAAAALAVFYGSTYVSLVLMNVLLSGQLLLHPLFFVGDLYQAVLLKSAGALPPWLDFVRTATGNLAALGFLVGLPLFYGCLYVWRRFRSSSPPDADFHAFIFLLLLTLSVTGFVVAMTINFTAHVGGGEVWRIHGRYYSFVLPLFLILGGAAAFQSDNRYLPNSALRIAALFALALLAMIWNWRTTYTIFPYDFPELFALSAWPTLSIIHAFFLTAAASYILMIIWPKRGPLLYAGLILLLNLTSFKFVSDWQSAHGRQWSALVDQVSAIRKLFLEQHADRGIVIGPDRNYLAFALFPLRSRSLVVEKASGTIVDAEIVGGAEWVILLGSYKIALEGDVVFQKNALTVVALKPVQSLK